MNQLDRQRRLNERHTHLNGFSARTDRRSMMLHSSAGFRFIFRVFPFIWISIFLLIVAFWIGIGVLTYKAGTSISEVGLKGVAQQVWCGDSDLECELPSIGSGNDKP